MMASLDGRTRSERGFTLVELMVTMLIGGALASIGGAAIFNWQRTSQHQGSAQEVVSQLRKAAERSVSEGRTYCIDVTPTRSYALWRYSCSAAGSRVEGVKTTQSSRVTLQATSTLPTPAPACPSGDTCIYFYPRGTATPATVLVKSTGRSKVYTIRVEGLTARVYM